SSSTATGSATGPSRAKPSRHPSGRPRAGGGRSIPGRRCAPASDEEVGEDRHREGGERRSDRARPDLRFREGQTLTHEPDFPLSADEIKFLCWGSDRRNFSEDFSHIQPPADASYPLTNRPNE